MNELQNVVRAYEQASQAGRAAALASVVNVRGSTYRRIGAHLLITEDGEVTGAISGGCLEQDVHRHAMWVMQSGTAKHVVYDSTGDDDDVADRFSVGCNGVVEVLVERLLPGDAYMAFVAGCLVGPQSGVVATVFATGFDGSIAAPSRLLWCPGKEARALGVKDAQLRWLLLEGARSVLASGASSARTFDTDAGRVNVCCEIFGPPPRIAIFGGGNDAVPVAAMAKALGAKVIVVDPRPGHATRLRFPNADRLMAAEPQTAVDLLALDGNSLALVMNHNYPQDLAALGALLPTPIRYLGVLGPKRRTARLLQDLAARGVVATEDQLARMYSPVGLDIGADTPDEVGLAIVAEMKAVLAGRQGGSLRRRTGTLHERPDPMPAGWHSGRAIALLT
jgi:xanthine/CO dehydrogenase XdhC/CoxF family maturation factor